jgi:hypothetical protein
MLTYDLEEKSFVELEPSNFNTEYFEKGSFPTIPFNMALKESELLGAGSPYNNEESDIDISDEESEMDPYDQFSLELDKLFQHCLEAKNINKQSQK